MLRTYNVSINGKHFFDEFGLVMQSKEISAAVPKTKLIEIPGRDGSIDVSEILTDGVVYEDRTLKMQFYSPKKITNWSSEISNINSQFAGKICKFVFDDDVAFYWKGRISSITPKYDGPIEYIELIATIEPYKYDVASSTVDWEWDVFDFEEGIINETNQLVVSGQREVILICRQKRMFPEFTVSAQMTVEYDDETYTLPKGKSKQYGLFLKEGNNTLLFRGNGTVTIDYVGGAL